MQPVEHVVINNAIAAIIIYNDYKKSGIEFFTPGDFSQQLGYMRRPKGHTIQPHLHKLHSRAIHLTQETLFIRTGKVKIDFYSDNKNVVESRVLTAGDVILLASGGHGFEFLEDSEVIEVKQGPYIEDEDKVRF